MAERRWPRALALPAALSAIAVACGVGSLSIHKYLTAPFSALAPQSPSVPCAPIYAGIGRSSSQGQRMPIFRLEKFAVTQSDGIAQSHIFFRAHLTKLQSKANSPYAIENTVIKSRSDHAPRQGLQTRFHSCAPPDSLKKCTNEPKTQPPLARSTHTPIPAPAS